MAETKEKSFFTDLWERRFPQFFFTYLGIVWGVTQFLVFLTTRYDLPSSIVDKFLLFCTILLPSVAVYIYNHGRPGKDVWKPFEKMLIPINFIVALGAAFLVGNNNSSVQASPKEVEIVTEEGETVKRLIPAMNQTKSFSVFPFSNSGSKKDDWIKFGAPFALKLDLEQDMRIHCTEPFNYKYELESNNHQLTEDNVPLKTHLKIAKEESTDYFLRGETESIDGQTQVKLQVYETESGELFFENVSAAENLYDCIDELKTELLSSLFLIDSKSSKEDYTDLPVMNLISQEINSFENYTKAAVAQQLNDYANVAQYISKSVELDPNNSLANMLKADTDYQQGRKENAVSLLEKTIRNSEDLPERQKFELKEKYYIYSDNFNKALKLMETRKKLYPSDYKPYRSLINIYSMIGRLNDAKAIGLDAIDNGHGKRVLKKLSEICTVTKDYAEAEKYINEYYLLHPDKNKEEDEDLTKIYIQQGKFDLAEERYENMAILHPGDFKHINNLAELKKLTGNFNQSEMLLKESLSKCNLRADSIEILKNKMALYSTSGETAKFKAASKLREELIAADQGILAAHFSEIMELPQYITLGLYEEVIKKRAETIARITPEHSLTYECVSEYMYDLTMKNPENFDKFATGACSSILFQGVENSNVIIDGLVAKFEGRHEEAIEKFLSFGETSGLPVDLLAGWLIEEYRLLGDYKSAEKLCKESLVSKPGDPTLLLELVKIYKATNHKDTQATCDKLSKLWSKAEPSFIYYEEFKNLEAEIGSI